MHRRRHILFLTILPFILLGNRAAAESSFTIHFTPPGSKPPRVAELKSPALVLAAPGTSLRVAGNFRLPTALGKEQVVRDIQLLTPTAPGVTESHLLTVDRQTLRLILVVSPEITLSRGTSGDLSIGGAPIGWYADPTKAGAEKVRRHPEAYAPPRAWVPVTEQTRNAWVSPSLRLGELQVQTDLAAEFPLTHLPLSYPLLDAIEIFRAALRSQGLPKDALRPISIYRSSAHNRAVGSGRYGRHIYGDAFDYVIDLNGDGLMDDLTGDGKVDRQDGFWCIALIEELMARGELPLGGIGLYTFSASKEGHKVTLHLDLRGHRATWAFHHDARGRKSEFAWVSRHFPEEPKQGASE